MTAGRPAPHPWGHGPEEQLHGGTANRGLVVRVGDTVRRPLRPTSAATHALLEHLTDVGFEGAPRHLGVDDRGREVLSYIPGAAVTPPYPRWALTRDALSSVAHLVRRYHDAVASFDASALTWATLPPEEHSGDGLISHNDLNLDNVVFRDGRAVALIDFDLAAPGSRLWDVAGAARLWAPLRAPEDILDPRRDEAVQRLTDFVAAYGLPLDPVALVAAVLANHEWLYQLVSSGAADGQPGFASSWSPAAPGWVSTPTSSGRP